MAQDTLLGFPAHTLPYRCGEFTTLSTVSIAIVYWGAAAKTPQISAAAQPSRHLTRLQRHPFMNCDRTPKPDK